MKMYIAPLYEAEEVKTSDAIMSSAIKSAGEATVGNITGEKGIFESLFEEIF